MQVSLFRRAVFALSLGLCVELPAGAQEDAGPVVTPEIGTYHWPNGTVGVEAFAAWLNRANVWALDFIGGESWDNVGWPVFWLEAWGKWVQAQPGRRLILAVPILAGPPDGSGPTQGGKGRGIAVSLERGASGDYNQHFTDLAANLVRYHLADTILRPASEFNGNWYTWKARGKTKAFIEYWRQIVTTMRVVPGAQNLKFCWNPTLGDQDFPADEGWPGDEFVDLVGIDVYDETWNANTYHWAAGISAEEIERRRHKAWDEWQIYSHRGLAFWTKFAREHGKPLCFPEWGVVEADHGFGGMDDPYFIEQMHRFIRDPVNRVAFHCYFDVNTGDHRHLLSPGVPGASPNKWTRFPKASARFRALFSLPPK
jgi:hypothetical protein